MPRLTRDEILKRIRGEKPQEEIELEKQVMSLETPNFSQQEQAVAGVLGTALGSIGAAGFRGLGDESRAKGFQQEAQKAGGLFAEKEAQREAIREKLQEKIGKKRKERLKEGLIASKERRSESEEMYKEQTRPLELESKKLGLKSEQRKVGKAKRIDAAGQRTLPPELAKIYPGMKTFEEVEAFGLKNPEAESMLSKMKPKTVDVIDPQSGQIIQVTQVFKPGVGFVDIQTGVPVRDYSRATYATQNVQSAVGQGSITNQAREAIRKDRELNDMKETLTGYGRVSNLAELASKGNQQALGSLQTQIARVVGGEVGALSEGDVQRAGGDISLLRRAKGLYYRLIDGSLQPESYKNLVDVMGVLRPIYEQKYQNRLDTYTRDLDLRGYKKDTAKNITEDFKLSPKQEQPTNQTTTSESPRQRLEKLRRLKKLRAKQRGGQ